MALSLQMVVLIMENMHLIRKLRSEYPNSTENPWIQEVKLLMTVLLKMAGVVVIVLPQIQKVTWISDQKAELGSQEEIDTV
jgi:hypothetical protein